MRSFAVHARACQWCEELPPSSSLRGRWHNPASLNAHIIRWPSHSHLPEGHTKPTSRPASVLSHPLSQAARTTPFSQPKTLNPLGLADNWAQLLTHAASTRDRRQPRVFSRATTWCDPPRHGAKPGPHVAQTPPLRARAQAKTGAGRRVKTPRPTGTPNRSFVCAAPSGRCRGEARCRKQREGASPPARHPVPAPRNEISRFLSLPVVVVRAWDVQLPSMLGVPRATRRRRGCCRRRRCGGLKPLLGCTHIPAGGDETA